MQETVRIENDILRVEVDTQSGAIRSVYDKVGQLELIAEPDLAESFRLLLPLADLEANYILSSEQRVSAVEKTANSLIVRWDGPLCNAQGQYDLAVTVYIELVDESIQLRIEVENRTPHRLAEAWHGALGGLMGLADRQATDTLLPMAFDYLKWSDSLFRQFPESMGVGSGGGWRFPEYYVRYPWEISMPWMSIYNSELDRGVYYAYHDPTPHVSTLHFEMHPGLARNRAGGNWPTDDEIAEMRDQYPPGLVVHWVHFPYTNPGETFSSAPVVLQCHDGDWHRAAKLYRAWFVSQFPVCREESWLRQQQAVQDCLLMLPEGNITMTYKDIPQWAKDALDYGVKTVMISGWWVGGHDGEDPNYAPEPRLGTWEELAEAIEECHKMGIRVLFFTNIGPVDISTDWYRDELYKYRLMDGKGQSWLGGWGMGTLGARIGFTGPSLSLCDPAFPAYRKIIVDQMRKLAEIGADGIHFDKVTSLFDKMDFNPDAGLPPDQAWFQGTIDCMEETLASCQDVREDFCLGVESPWDRLLSYCDAWWLWHDRLDHVPVMKYAFPEFLPTFAVVQPWDYVNVNNAIRFGYQILVGPVRYSASMQDEQSRPISNYIAEVLRIREELRDTIFLGDFLDTLEVSVVGSDQLRYSTHRNLKTGKRACVLVNAGMAPLEASVTGFAGNAMGEVSLFEPYRETRQARLPVAVVIPPERLVIVVEN